MTNPIEDFITHNSAQLSPECQAELRALWSGVETERALFKAILEAIRAASGRMLASELAFIAALSSQESPLGQLLLAALGLSNENRQCMTLVDLQHACNKVSDAIARLKDKPDGR